MVNPAMAPPAQNQPLDWDAEHPKVALDLDRTIAQENNLAEVYDPARDYQHLLVWTSKHTNKY